MPAWTPLGVKSSSSDASWFGRSVPELPPQPASARSAPSSRIRFREVDTSSARSMFGSLTAFGEEAPLSAATESAVPATPARATALPLGTPAAYAAELLGTFVLVLFIVLAVSATAAPPAGTGNVDRSEERRVG